MNVRTKKLLQDALSAADAIQAFIRDTTRADYQTDELLRSCVERKFEIIGEALMRLRGTDPDTFLMLQEAGGIIAFRNRLIRGYDTVEHEIVWEVVHHKLPALRTDLERLLVETV